MFYYKKETQDGYCYFVGEYPAPNPKGLIEISEEEYLIAEQKLLSEAALLNEEAQ